VNAARVLVFGPEAAWLAPGLDVAPDAARMLPLGDVRLVRERFAGAFPRAAHLEAAIAAVEDALMAMPPLPASTAPLWVEDAVLHDTLRASGFAAGAAITLGLDDVERLFGRLVAASHGRPASQHGLPDDAAFAARLLVLREAMHHLHFPSLIVETATARGH
jgi:hypothetical protein